MYLKTKLMKISVHEINETNHINFNMTRFISYVHFMNVFKQVK